MRSAKVVGVHPVEADQPCHLIELTICDPDREFNVNDLTQVDENIERGLWQAASDERYLDARSLQPLPQRPDHTGFAFDPGVRLEPPRPQRIPADFLLSLPRSREAFGVELWHAGAAAAITAARVLGVHGLGAAMRLHGDDAPSPAK